MFLSNLTKITRSTGMAYWLQKLPMIGAGRPATVNGRINSDGNFEFLVSAGTSAGTAVGTHVLSFDPNGALSKSTSGLDNSNPGFFSKLAVNGSNYYFSVSAALFAKYDTTGIIDRKSAASITDLIAVDSSDNLYMANRRTISAQQAVSLQKVNSSYTVQWEQSYYTSGQTLNPTALIISAAGDPYVCYLNSSNTCKIVKYNPSTGAGTWFRTISVGGVNAGNIAQMPNGDFIWTGGTTTTANIMRFDSSGTRVWGVSATNVGSLRGIAFDSSNNVYLFGQNGASLYIVKLDSSGALVFARKLTGPTTTTMQPSAIAIDESQSAIYIAGPTGANTLTTKSALLVAKLPMDGTGTGTYDGIVYDTQASTVGDDSGTFNSTTFTSSTGNTVAITDDTTSVSYLHSNGKTTV